MARPRTRDALARDRAFNLVRRLINTAGGPGAGRKLIWWGDDATAEVCPVRMECLAYAMGRHERHGIWGGLTFNERQALRRAGYEADERRKARRRAVAAARRQARSVTITTDRGANQTWQ